MIRRDLYYKIKPLVPLSVRRGVRRWFATRKREKVGGIWPVLPGSEKAPSGWPGWPGGKKFAFVLSHDVEGQFGVDQSRKLMEMEMKLGFRSSFNFIPEGEYRVTRELRDELTGKGFEVGVHDLHHDGKIFQSREAFATNAAQVNRYLKEWGAVGFRAGFMLHKLDWLTDLNIQYDASTFDTDPFEPQPDGAGTIFPFWRKCPNGEGYVELPYTLPQDSTLFLLFRETNLDIWLRKLDWVASHGGMALVNVHPDYMHFDGNPPKSGTFPADFYRRLLQYVKEKYDSTVWLARPKDVAAWYKEVVGIPASESPSTPRMVTSPTTHAKEKAIVRAQRQSGRAAVVVYAYYELDARPKREAEALVQEGMVADVIALRQNDSKPSFEALNGVNLHRVSLSHKRDSQIGYVMRYGFFFLSAFWRLTIWSLRGDLRLVHVHNMPDFLVFTAFVPRLTGAKVILDLHDPMPELYGSIYAAPEKQFAYRLLRRLERWSIAFADKVLTPNTAFKRLFVSRSNASDKVEIIMNTPDATVFDGDKYQSTSSGPDKPFTIMYHGLLVERHGLDLAVRALASLRDRMPRVKFEIYGEPTDYMDEVLSLSKELGMGGTVEYKGLKPLNQIPSIISTIDLGIIPNRLNLFTEINFPTRIFEYLAMNKPVIVPRTTGIQDYFTDDSMIFFRPGDIEDLAKQIEWAWAHPEDLRCVMEKGRDIYRQHLWVEEEKRFMGIVDELLDGKPAPIPAVNGIFPQQTGKIE
ncbi:MAG TPA: glycosyltransferase [Verrucomicrobiae bacterium]|jgi:glycosyltransferase involved in cell wall biosynthesis